MSEEEEKEGPLYVNISETTLDKLADKIVASLLKKLDSGRLLPPPVAVEEEVAPSVRTQIAKKLGEVFNPEDATEIKMRFSEQIFNAEYGWLLSEDPRKVADAITYFQRELAAVRETESQSKETEE